MPGAGRLGDRSQLPADAHGCPGCPHPALGPAVSGSPDVNINSRPALRVGDSGAHAACCGPNTWTAVRGAPAVFINGRPAHRVGDADQHCGGIGRMIEGSGNVMIGNEGGGAGGGARGERRTTKAVAAPSARTGPAVPLRPIVASRSPAVDPLRAGMVFQKLDAALAITRTAADVAANPGAAVGDLLKLGAHFGLDRLGELVLGKTYYTVEAIGRQAWRLLREIPLLGDYLGVAESYANNVFDTFGYWITGQLPDFYDAPPGNVDCLGELPSSLESGYILLEDSRQGGDTKDGLWHYAHMDVTYPLRWLLDLFAPEVWYFRDDSPAIGIRDLMGVEHDGARIGAHGRVAANGNFDIDDEYARSPWMQAHRGPYLSAWKMSNQLIQMEAGFLRAGGFHPCSRPDGRLSFEHESDGERAYIYLQIDEVESPDPAVRVGVARVVRVVGTGHGHCRPYDWDRLTFKGTHPRVTIARGSHATGVTTGLLPSSPGIAGLVADYYAGPGVDGAVSSQAFLVADEAEAGDLYDRVKGHAYGNHQVVGKVYECYVPGPQKGKCPPTTPLPTVPSPRSCPRGERCGADTECRPLPVPSRADPVAESNLAKGRSRNREDLDKFRYRP